MREISISGNEQPIEVFYDERDVPHVFAKNDHDMFFAQGYLTAKHRLWQMDFISYVSSGRLSEVFGEGYISYDRTQRRLGMLSSAKTTLKFIEENSETKIALDAYTAGVNQYIESLQYKNFPFEYKLMGYQPEPWTNLKSVLIMKYVANMLTIYEEDIAMSQMLLTIGEKEFRKLYPECSLPDDKKPAAILNTVDVNKLPYKEYINYEFLSKKKSISPNNYNPRLGSNNWAINASKSKSGNPILCNDPHLNLSLPSIWYEIQLSSNTTNVYGVSIPGTIGVIIGFNNNIAWGVTNGSADVKDWYKLTLKSDYSQYLLHGKWQNINKSVEEIKIKDQSSFFDTVYSTIHGPILIDKHFNEIPHAKNLALKWSLHEPSNEFLTFIHLNKGKDYSDFKEAISHYQCPVQNFAFISSNNEIAIHHQGALYKKWNGQGRFILDGSKMDHLYKEKISATELPQSYNPSCGYVFSANNFPLYDTVSNYFNGYFTENRAIRIKNILDSKEKFSIEDMKQMQLDNINEIAELLLPEMLKNMDSEKIKEKKDVEIISKLLKWDYRYLKSSTEAFFFENWLRNLEDLTWDELSVEPDYIKHPDPIILYSLIKNEKESKYFDILNTNKTEILKDVLLESFIITSQNYTSQKWEDEHKINIEHLAKLNSFSDLGFTSDGHPDAINAISENWGPSWRMIVELGKRPNAFGIYAGGQSGNASSTHYDDFIDSWKKGQYYRLNYFINEAEAKKETKQQTTLLISK
jgi:penicillin amidase